MRERFRITRIARIGHLPHDEQLHLLGKIERAAELQRLDLAGADPVAKIGEVRPAHGQRGAGQDAGAIIPENHPPQDRRDVDRRGVEGEELRGFPGAFDPVNVAFGALFEKGHDADTRFVHAPTHLLQLRFQKFVLGPFHHLGDARLKRDQAPGNRVRHEIRFAHADLAAFPKIAALIDRAEESIDVVHDRGGQSYAGGIAGNGEKALARSRVIKALHGRAQSILRDAEADLARGGLLDRVGLIENDEIIREKVTTLALLLFLRRAEKHEEQSVIDDDHIRREQAFARLLEKTIRTLAAGLAGADVRLTANLGPDFRIRFHREIAQRSILRRARPFRDARQFRRLRRGEEFAGLLQRALEPARAKVILPPLHQRSLELDRQNLLQDRDVLVKKLLLQVDRVRRDHRLLFLLDREENGGREVSDRFADASPGLDHEMTFFLESAGHGHRHRLLLRPVLEVLRLGQQSIFRKERADLLDEVTAEGISKRDHDEELRLPICNLRFVYEPVEALRGSGNLVRKSKFQIPKFSHETARSLRPASFLAGLFLLHRRFHLDLVHLRYQRQHLDLSWMSAFRGR